MRNLTESEDGGNVANQRLITPRRGWSSAFLGMALFTVLAITPYLHAADSDDFDARPGPRYFSQCAGRSTEIGLSQSSGAERSNLL